MSLSDKEIKKIKRYESGKFEHLDKTHTYNVTEIVKYVIYWKQVMEENSRKIMYIPQSGQTTVAGYDQLKHISQGDLDDNSPKSVMKKQIAMFTRGNNISDDMLVIISGYIEQYYSLMGFGNYKNPVYLSVAIMILHEKTTQQVEDVKIDHQVVEDTYYGEEGFEESDEFRGGSDSGGESDF
jgi:hypothetical protein